MPSSGKWSVTCAAMRAWTQNGGAGPYAGYVREVALPGPAVQRMAPLAGQRGARRLQAHRGFQAASDSQGLGGRDASVPPAVAGALRPAVASASGAGADGGSRRWVRPRRRKRLRRGVLRSPACPEPPADRPATPSRRHRSRGHPRVEASPSCGTWLPGAVLTDNLQAFHSSGGHSGGRYTREKRIIVNDRQSTSHQGAVAAHPVARATPVPSMPSVAGGSEGVDALPPLPPTSSPDKLAPVGTAKRARLRRLRQLLPNRKRRWVVVAALVGAAVIGVSVGLATSHSTTAGQVSPTSGAASGVGSTGVGSNARSGPAAGGAAGTVGTVTPSGFTMSTSAGQTVTVDEAPSTTYRNGTAPTSASALTTGEGVLVLGTTNGTTITATQVIVQPNGGTGSATSSAADVIPFQRGASTTSKQVGQIPADFSQGSGTIVSGTAANQATEAALAAYPGGIVDRVVKLSNGEYEAHTISVNWPHHVFVTQQFKVVGAN